MISRRSVAGLIGGIALGGREATAKMVASAQRGGIPVPPLNHPYPENAQAAGCVTPVPPKMEHWQAVKLAMADPDLRAVIISAAYAQHREIHQIDPDIQIIRSFSPMAKIAFQRQRNVARDIARMTTNSMLGWGSNKVQEFIQKAMFG